MIKTLFFISQHSCFYEINQKEVELNQYSHE